MDQFEFFQGLIASGKGLSPIQIESVMAECQRLRSANNTLNSRLFSLCADERDRLADVKYLRSENATLRAEVAALEAELRGTGKILDRLDKAGSWGVMVGLSALQALESDTTTLRAELVHKDAVIEAQGDVIDSGKKVLSLQQAMLVKIEQALNNTNLELGGITSTLEKLKTILDTYLAALQRLRDVEEGKL